MHADISQGADWPTGRVLVADDDDEFRAAVAEIIALDGWQVWQASDGEEALRYALELRPDVLVLDQRMPAFTGVEVVQRLRAAGVPVPVVLVSAAHDLEALAESLGIRCRLMKPFGFEELGKMLKRAQQGHCGVSSD